MKGVVTAAIIALVMIVGGALYTNHIETVSEQLGSINDDIMVYLTDGNFEGAADEMGKLIEKLERNRVMLAATGDHADFDKIEMSISEMAGYISGSQQTDAISMCKVLSFMFEHMPKNYQLKLENIL